MCVCVYIYIYIKREREKEIHAQLSLFLILSFLFCFKMVRNLKETGRWHQVGTLKKFLNKYLCNSIYSSCYTPLIEWCI